MATVAAGGAEGVDLGKVVDQVGYAVVDGEGRVLEASGDLAGEAGASVCATVVRMVKDAGAVLAAGQGLGAQKMQRMTVTFGSCHYVAVVADDRVVVVKKATGREEVA